MFSAMNCGLDDCLVQPSLAYLIVDFIPRLRQIRRFVMDFFYQCCNSPVFQFVFRYFPIQPFIVGCSGHPAQLTKCLYRIIMFLVFFSDCLIYRFMTNQAQPRLLSISSNFFKNDNSISARCRLAFSSFNSA